MSFLQSVPSLCCRRRTLISRVIPALLQVIIIVVIWKIVKSRASAKNDVKDVSKRDVPMAVSSDQQRCLFAEFSQAQWMSFFNVSSILTSSNLQEKVSQNPRLLFDVYVRDKQKGTVQFYPAGTPANGYEDTKVDDQNKDIVYDLGNHFPNYDTYGVKGPQIVNDKAPKNMNQGLNQLLANRAGSPQQVNGNYNKQGFQYGFGNMQNQNLNSVDQQRNVNGISGFIPNPMLRSDAGAQQGQEIGHGGHIDASINQYQNGLEQANQHPVQQPFQNVGALGSRNKVNELVDSSNKQKLHQLPSGNAFQGSVGGVFGAQGQNNANGNVQIDNNQLNYQNIQSPFEIQQWRGADYQGQQIPAVQQWGGAGSNIQQNRQVPSNVQQWGVAGSGPQIQSPNIGVPFNGNTEPLLMDGYLDRAKKFITELRGKPVNVSISETGAQPVLLHMNNPQTCQGFTDVHLLYLVASQPQSSDMRQRIRNTFANASFFQPSIVAHVFLLGETSSPNFQLSLNQEQQQFGDIVQGNFMDIPENASYKGLMGMQWVAQFCPQAKYVMIINEDVFVDTDKLLHSFIPATKTIASERIMLCFFTPESPIPRAGPNAVSVQLFPGRTKIRPYCKGFAILTTPRVITSLLAAVVYVPLFQLDELYLYGILPLVAGGVNVFDVGNKRAFHNFGLETVVCYQQQQDKCQYVASIAFSDRFTTLWEITKSRMQRMQQTNQGWTEGQPLWRIHSYVRRF
ncbi:hypothetical protein BsWGS_20180 [Bradybaena similaris]